MTTTLINSTLNVLFSLISTFLKIILAPIDTLIMNGLPDVEILIEKLSDFLVLCTSFVGWVIDALAIPSGVITLIVSYFTLKYSILLISIPIKIVIRWVKTLK